MGAALPTERYAGARTGGVPVAPGDMVLGGTGGTLVVPADVAGEAEGGRDARREPRTDGASGRHLPRRRR